jgi:sorbitol-6-phosphate 2-dehydrogenase
MNRGDIAALLRGLCINAAGKPQCVVCEETKGDAIPEGAMVFSVGEGESDEKASEAVRAAYSTWKKDAVAGKITLPSCAALCDNGKPLALYWTDNDFDAAKKRQTERNASPREEAVVEEGTVIDPADRAALFKNRVALVTGGAQGIGEEIVRNLTAMGALVYIADLNLEGAQKLAQDINAGEKRTAAIGLKVNVSDEPSVKDMFNTIAETSGGLDLCVSNAGVLRAASVLEQELADFKFVTDINYTGFFIISKHAGKLLSLQYRTAPKWKTDIIQINSKSGLEGSNRNGAYAGGKFGGLGLVASFAKELVEYNIKVNAICPGNFLNGPLWSDPEKGLFVQYLKTGKVPGAKNVADVRAYYEGKVPMKRGCTGKDLARAIFYLVEQEYETGQALPVTGGQVMLH